MSNQAGNEYRVGYNPGPVVEQQWRGHLWNTLDAEKVVERLNDLHTAARVGRDALEKIAVVDQDNAPSWEQAAKQAVRIAIAALGAMSLGGRGCLHVSAQPLFEPGEYGFLERTNFTWCQTCGSLLDKSGKWRQPSAMSPTTGGKE